MPPPAVLYVEGPRDRDILEGWARGASASLGRALNDAAVILGGRQPDRAVSHFLAEREKRPGLQGLCVLDRDGGDEPIPVDLPGLEVFTWSRRHIESYLLVPTAIERSLRNGDGARAARLLRRHLPAGDDERTLRDFDASRARQQAIVLRSRIEWSGLGQVWLRPPDRVAIYTPYLCQVPFLEMPRFLAIDSHRA